MTKLPPPPRQIFPVRTHPIARAIGYLFLFLVLVITLTLAVVLGNELLLKWFGHEVSASVTALEDRPGSSGVFNYLARYNYDTPSITRTDQSYINWGEYRRLSEPFRTSAGRPDVIHFPTTAPATMPIRAYGIGPLTFSRAVENEGGFILLLIPALFVPVLSFFYYALYFALIIRPRRLRYLYTHGAAIAGVITGRRLIRTRHLDGYSIAYTYAPPDQSPLVTHTYIDKRQYEANPPAETVTILYDPEKPKRSVIYELGGYYCNETV